MPVSSNMSPETLDAIFNRAKANEEFAAYCDKLIDQSFDNRDLFDDDMDDYATEDFSNRQWTDEDEAVLEQYEIDKRERLAIKNEY